MQLILITGGMGFIGLHTARRFLDAGESVLLTQYRVRREPEFLRSDIGGRLTIAILDVTDSQKTSEMVQQHGVNGIVHLAGPGRGVLSIAEEYRAYLEALLSVMEAALAGGVRRVILAGAVGMYSSLPAGPFREDAPLALESKGSSEAAKKAWEVLASRFTEQTGIEMISLRIPIVYGPLYHSMANLPSRICHAAVRGTRVNLDDLRVGTAHTGDAHDYCYVKDCAAGIQLLMEAKQLKHPVYNIGGGRAVTNGEIAGAARKAIAGAELSLPAGQSSGNRRNPYSDLSRIHADAGYSPAYDIDRGIGEYIEWLRHHPE